MEMWTYLDNNWFIAWCALWLGWPAFGIIKLLVFSLPNRILRTIKVSIRGWTPEHLDADGDWKPLPKTD